MTTEPGSALTIEIPHSEPTAYAGHGYFRYIGKFPPQIAQLLLRESEGPVLDAMVGGGTTLTEARLRGIDAVGLDVNPVALYVARASSRPLNPDFLQHGVQQFKDGILAEIRGSPTLFSEALRKPAPRRHDWCGLDDYFPRTTLMELDQLRDAILVIQPEELRTFLTVAVLSILRRVSFANIKKMNIEKDENRTSPPRAIDVLEKRLGEMQRLNLPFWSEAKPAASWVGFGDAKRLPFGKSTYETVILHPPYMTNTAFSESTQLQLAYLGVPFRRIWRRELRCRGSFVHEPDGLRKYLIGWAQILAEAKRVAKSRGRVCAVIGDGQVDHVRIPLGEISVAFASDLGMKLTDRYFHRLNNNTGRTQSRRMVGQHVLVFESP